MSVNMIDDQKCEIWACSARPVSLHSRDKEWEDKSETNKRAKGRKRDGMFSDPSKMSFIFFNACSSFYCARLIGECYAKLKKDVPLLFFLLFGIILFVSVYSVHTTI